MRRGGTQPHRYCCEKSRVATLSTHTRAKSASLLQPNGPARSPGKSSLGARGCAHPEGSHPTACMHAARRRADTIICHRPGLCSRQRERAGPALRLSEVRVYCLTPPNAHVRRRNARPCRITRVTLPAIHALCALSHVPLCLHLHAPTHAAAARGRRAAGALTALHQRAAACPARRRRRPPTQRRRRPARRAGLPPCVIVCVAARASPAPAPQSPARHAAADVPAPAAAPAAPTRPPARDRPPTARPRQTAARPPPDCRPP